MRVLWLVVLVVLVVGCSAPAGDQAGVGKKQANSESPAVTDSTVLGEWLMVDDGKVESTPLDLRSDGTFSVAGATGTFKVSKEGGRTVELTFSDKQQGTLRLATDESYGVMFDEFGIVYCRKGDEAKAKEFMEKKGEDGSIAN
ncbi:MAG TPA: hypothetical protein VNI20_08405 [Fimbriimonadaceae bacterium]|nr:hypothetical protein [Fimbriimonadaceae bacterium]